MGGPRTRSRLSSLHNCEIEIRINWNRCHSTVVDILFHATILLGLFLQNRSIFLSLKSLILFVQSLLSIKLWLGDDRHKYRVLLKQHLP